LTIPSSGSHQQGRITGEVRATARLRNFLDVGLAERGLGTAAAIPSSVRDCLVDTGAMMVLLPEDEVGKLALLRGGRVILIDADERKDELPVAHGLEIEILGRTMVTDCVVGLPLCEPLTGQLVLEQLDLVVDRGHRTLTPRPESPNLPMVKLK
jgi:predicted aspartyl protease